MNNVKKRLSPLSDARAREAAKSLTPRNQIRTEAEWLALYRRAKGMRQDGVPWNIVSKRVHDRYHLNKKAVAFGWEVLK